MLMTVQILPDQIIKYLTSNAQRMLSSGFSRPFTLKSNMQFIILVIIIPPQGEDAFLT